MINGSRNDGNGGIFTRATRIALQPQEDQFYGRYSGFGRPPRSEEQKARRLEQYRRQYERARIVGLRDEMARIASAYQELSGQPIESGTGLERQARSRHQAMAEAAVDSLRFSDFSDSAEEDALLQEALQFDDDGDLEFEFAPNPQSVQGGDPPQPSPQPSYGGHYKDPYRPGHPYNHFGYCRPNYDTGRGG